MKTINPKQNENYIWLEIDATNKVLGRLSSKISTLLRGKNQPCFSKNSLNTITNIVVINSDKIKLTGKKSSDKIYWKHTGYVGGIKQIKYPELVKKSPKKPLIKAVKGMMPKNRLSRSLMRRLKVYTGSINPHKAQDCIKIDL